MKIRELEKILQMMCEETGVFLATNEGIFEIGSVEIHFDKEILVLRGRYDE